MSNADDTKSGFIRMRPGLAPPMRLRREIEQMEASEQARLDLEQDAPNDRAVATFREEMARSGNPYIATIAAMDVWLRAEPKRGGA